ncbi:MAG: hypothetical protein HY719_14640 [Planctomycetes bacterium]|nr:hypothetical protein [Planctomycetota bacterium]
MKVRFLDRATGRELEAWQTVKSFQIFQIMWGAGLKDDESKLFMEEHEGKTVRRVVDFTKVRIQLEVDPDDAKWWVAKEKARELGERASSTDP